MSDEPGPHLFEIDGDHFVPTRTARGYWRKGTLSGSAAASLLGFVINRDFLHDGGEWIPVRFGVDLLRMAPALPLQVETTVVHASNRLRLVEARIMAEGRQVTRALCQMVRPGLQPANPVWQSPGWSAPDPETLPRMTQFAHWDARAVPPDPGRPARARPGTEALHDGNPPVLGVLAPVEARQTWLRIRAPIVAGHDLSPFTRVALAGDFASPLSHSSERGIDFVNTDFTVHLHRLPQDEWLGFELTGHSSAQGVAVGQCALHDRGGPLGTVSVTALSLARQM